MDTLILRKLLYCPKQVAYEYLGHIGPFQIAIALTFVVLAKVWTWEEVNHLLPPRICCQLTFHFF